MLLFFSGLYSLFLVVLLFIAILIAIVAVLSKNGTIKILTGILASGVFLFIIVIWYNDMITTTGISEQYEKKIIGIYKLDTLTSEMLPYPPRQYIDLELEIKKDHTFRFSRAVPFISGTFGKWMFTVGNDINYSEFMFKDAIYPDNNNFQFSADSTMVEIGYPTPRSINEQVRRLFFERIR